MIGVDTLLHCFVTNGDLPLTFHWYKDGIQLIINTVNSTNDRGKESHIVHLTPYSQSLHLYNIQKKDEGLYTCSVYNQVGSSNYSATLLVQGIRKICTYGKKLQIDFFKSLIERIFRYTNNV